MIENLTRSNKSVILFWENRTRNSLIAHNEYSDPDELLRATAFPSRSPLRGFEPDHPLTTLST